MFPICASVSTTYKHEAASSSQSNTHVKSTNICMLSIAIAVIDMCFHCTGKSEPE